MKYYKLKTVFNNANDRIASSASGDSVIDGDDYFTMIKDGKFHPGIPILNFFHLESYDDELYWDFQLNDIHNLIGKANTVIGYYISTKCKDIFGKFCLAPKCYFYETILCHKGTEKKYWLFQYGVDAFDNIELCDSVFSINQATVEIKNENEYWEKKREARKKYQSTLKVEKLFLKRDYDFLFNQINSDTIVSRKLKNEIELSGLAGFEFSELDYEVVVDPG